MLCSGLHGNGGRGEGRRRRRRRRGHPERLILSLSFHLSPLPPPWVSAGKLGILKGTGLGQAKSAGWRCEVAASR